MVKLIIFELEKVLVDIEFQYVNQDILGVIKKLKKQGHLIGYVSASPFCYHDSIILRISQYADSILWGKFANKQGLLELIQNDILKKNKISDIKNIENIYYLIPNDLNINNYLNPNIKIYKLDSNFEPKLFLSWINK